MNISEAVKEALAQNNNQYPVSIMHKHRKDSWGLFTIYVTFGSIKSLPTWIRIEELDGMFLPGDIYKPTASEFLYEDWEVAHDVPKDPKKGKKCLL